MTLFVATTRTKTVDSAVGTPFNMPFQAASNTVPDVFDPRGEKPTTRSLGWAITCELRAALYEFRFQRRMIINCTVLYCTHFHAHQFRCGYFGVTRESPTCPRHLGRLIHCPRLQPLIQHLEASGGIQNHPRRIKQLELR